MILICSNDTGLRQRWCEALPGHPDIQVASSFDDAIGLLRHQKPEITLFHLQMPGGGGIQAIADIRAHNEKTRTIVCTDVPDEDEGLKVIQLGARGYCNSHTSPMLLAKAIDVVRAGEVWVGRKLILRLIEMFSNQTRTYPNGINRSEFNGLTGRERQIADLVSDGDSNKRIALKLDITERTVKAHLTTVFQKLNVRDRLQLAIRVNEFRHQ